MIYIHSHTHTHTHTNMEFEFYSIFQSDYSKISLSCVTMHNFSHVRFALYVFASFNTGVFLPLYILCSLQTS